MRTFSIRRREFISLLGGGTVVSAAWTLAAQAQPSALPVMGYLSARSRESESLYGTAFHAGLKEAGFVEDRNVAIEYRWADFQYDRLPGLAADLAKRQVAVIFASPIPAAMAAKAATVKIPVVFAIGSDPVKVRLVANFNRPEGNITGVTWLGGPTLVAKRLELLHEAIPAATVIAVLINPQNNAAEAQRKESEQAAYALGLRLEVVNASTERDIDSVFKRLAQHGRAAMMVAPDAFFEDRRHQLVTLERRHTIPVMYYARAFADAGGLISYGTSYTDAYRQAGVYTGRILKGEKPANLPVLQAAKFELVVNLKTANALGLSLPTSMLARAEDVIE